VSEALVRISRVPNLSLLASGVPEETGELISTETMRSLLTELRTRFDCIVIDSAPLLPYADPRILAPLADGIILVGRHGISTKEAIRRSVELLREVHAAPVLDLVFNAVPYSAQAYGYSYGYAAKARSV
jgi:receptor protein-tyrosine kinase